MLSHHSGDGGSGSFALAIDGGPNQSESLIVGQALSFPFFDKRFIGSLTT